MNQASHDEGPSPGAEPIGGPGTPANAPADAGPPAAAPVAAVPRWAWGLLALVFAMHALGVADVWLLASVLQPIRQDLALDETDAGWLVTALLVGAAIGGPMVGYLADRWRRPRLLAVTFAGWSLAVVTTGLARSYDQIQFARAAAGAGGAATTVIALTLLADAFPRRMRGRAFAAFFMAMPVGVVLGRLLAATLPSIAGWPAAFLAAGAPGLLLALVALLLPEPVRGASEPVPEPRLRLHEGVGPANDDYVDLMVNSSFNYSVFGMAFSAFALAGLADWFPPYLVARGLPPDRADRLSTGILLAASAAGLAAGGLLADRILATRPRRLFLYSGLAMLAAIAGLLVAIYGRSAAVVGAGLLPAEAAMFLIVPPCFTILAGVTMPNMRGVGFGVALAAGHVLGDLWSPTLMGWVIENFAQRDFLDTGLGRLVAAIGAVPFVGPGRDPENLVAGLLALVPILLIAGVVLMAGIRHLPRELALMIAKLRALPSRR